MLMQSSKGVPIYPQAIAKWSSSPYQFGASPWQSGYGSLKGCGCGAYGGCGCAPTSPTSLRGLAGHGGGAHGVPMGGRGNYGTLAGLGQNVSLNQIVDNAFRWLSGLAQSNLPTSASVPPQYGSPGAFVTQLENWAPYLIIGYLAYRALK